MPANLIIWVSVALAVSEGLALIPGTSEGFKGILASVISVLKKIAS